MPVKIVTSDQMRQIEQACAASGIPTDRLMENAGLAVAEAVRDITDHIDRQVILCLIGPGNNGGDGLVAARYFHDWGARVSLYLCGSRPEGDPNLAVDIERDIPCFELAKDARLERLTDCLSRATIVIDAIFGTGKVRPFQGTLKEALERLAEAKRSNSGLRIVAIDLPSGLNADAGEVDPASPRADYTITLGFPKPGLFTFPGAEHVGKLTIADIGIPARLAESVDRDFLTEEWAGNLLPDRPLNSNKGTFGKALIVAGSINYTGAAYLACNGAMRVGAGLVTLATPSTVHSILAARLTETTFLPLAESEPGIVAPNAAETLAEQLTSYNTLLIGCGIGRSDAALTFASNLMLDRKLPTPVIDADALIALAREDKWWQRLPKDAILTPHPGEMARLCGLSIEEIQRDRLGIAERFAAQWQTVIVLKGAYTVIAAPDGRSRLSPFANPGLASAGTGDVLAGTIVGLIAQGLRPFDAAALGVYLHGEAGETVRTTMGEAGMLAGDLLPVLPTVIKRLKAGG